MQTSVITCIWGTALAHDCCSVCFFKLETDEQSLGGVMVLICLLEQKCCKTLQIYGSLKAG